MGIGPAALEPAVECCCRSCSSSCSDSSLSHKLCILWSSLAVRPPSTTKLPAPGCSDEPSINVSIKGTAVGQSPIFGADSESASLSTPREGASPKPLCSGSPSAPQPSVSSSLSASRAAATSDSEAAAARRSRAHCNGVFPSDPGADGSAPPASISASSVGASPAAAAAVQQEPPPLERISASAPAQPHSSLTASWRRCSAAR